MSDVLYDRVHKKALATWKGPKEVEKINFDEWVQHWFDTAYEIHDEFVACGLFKTATALGHMIDVQIDLMRVCGRKVIS